MDVWIPCMVVLTFYSGFNFRRGWLFWLAIGSLGLRFVPLPANFGWLSIGINYYLPFELIRLSIVALRRGLLGARIVTIGAFCNLGLWLTFELLSALHVSVGDHEWLYHGLFVLSFLCFPLTLSLRLALEHGWVNRQFLVRLGEVETLSMQNLAQQQERQQLLARQNERLEQQVAERTHELHQQAEQLRVFDGVKSRFVTNITHEFRTPLALILSPVEKLLQEGRFDRPMLTLVQRNAGQLLRLINQLLDLAKLEGNHMAVSPMQGDVTEFILHITDLFGHPAEQKGVTLTCVDTGLPPLEYVFDADKWEKILTNLLSNALKFTDTGGHIILTATPILTGNAMTGVQIVVADSGIGIAPAELPHIFDRFYQTDSSSTRAYEGTGIGLALVHELVDLLGGSIAVESALGAGTTFRLTLPVQPLSTVAEAQTVNWSAARPIAPVALHVPFSAPVSLREPLVAEYPAPRILVVEDNDELREFLVGELASAYHVFQANDGQEGWECVQTELPDMVITDVMMPRMDGHQLTRLIKTNPTTDHIAVVMLTAKAAQQSRLEGLQQGADDYLAKPFNVAELHLRLHNLVTRQQKLGDHYRQQFALPDAVDLPGIIGVPIDTPDAVGTPLLADPFLDRIYGLIEENLDDSALSVDWLADQLAISRKTLYRKVQSVIQLPPADLIRQYRLRKAADLLKAGHTVGETADLVGFNTPSHFSIVFKEFYQQTPTEFIANRP